MTDVITASVAAGHPRRTVELVMRGTDIKEQLHRTSLEQSLAKLPVELTQHVIEKILDDEKTNPSVVKLCLRLFETIHLNEPEELLLKTWREGKCHRDVDVHIKAMFAQFDQYSKGEELVFDVTKIGEKNRFSYVVRELIDMLYGTEWSSRPLVDFLSTAIDEGVVTANRVFCLLMERMFLGKGSFGAAKEAIFFLSKLVCSGQSLADPELHGLPDVSKDWNVCSENDYRFYQDEFLSVMIQQGDQSANQQLILTLAANRPASTRLLTAWAKLFLTGDMAADASSENIALGFRLTRHNKDSLLTLSEAATKQAVCNPAECVMAAARLVIEQVHAITKHDEQFISDRASLAAVSSVSKDLVTVYEDALLIDARNAEKKQTYNDDVVTAVNAAFEKEMCNDHHLLETAIKAAFEASPNSHNLAQLEWMQSKEEVVSKSSLLVSLVKRLAIKAMQGNKACANAVASFVIDFRAHPKMEGFDKVLLNFDVTAMLQWVQECVLQHEKIAGDETSPLPEPPMFHDTVMSAGAAEVLASSCLVSFRLRSFRYLPIERVALAAKQDEDYSARTVARALVTRAAEQNKLRS